LVRQNVRIRIPYQMIKNAVLELQFVFDRLSCGASDQVKLTRALSIDSAQI
jgi:hypothetical protein